MQHREIGKTNFIIIIFFLDAILIYSSSPRSRGRFDLREDRPPVKDRKKRRRRRDVGAQQRRLRHWILARRKISVLRINVSHKTNFWLTLEGIGEVVKKKEEEKKPDSPEPDTLTRRRGERKFPVSRSSKAAIQNQFRDIYICTCNRYYRQDSVHLLPLTINFSQTRSLPVSSFLWKEHVSRCIPV